MVGSGYRITAYRYWVLRKKKSMGRNGRLGPPGRTRFGRFWPWRRLSISRTSSELIVVLGFPILLKIQNYLGAALSGFGGNFRGGPLGLPFFFALPFRSFVGQSNAGSMLQSISWARFGAGVFIGLVIYYGYVLLRFYGRELSALLGRGEVSSNGIRQGTEVTKVGSGFVEGSGGSGAAEASAARGVVGQAPQRMEGGQGTMFPEAAVGETPELFKVAEKVIVLLRQMVNDAAATGVRREELEDRIRMLLSGYRQLVKTPYQVSINNFIARTCTTNFSLMLSDREIGELWEE